MNTEYFYYFVEAAHQQSMSKAAKAYNITQQGLSRAIKQLESEYGARLFFRDGSQITLTPAGEVFLEGAETLISVHNHLCDRMEFYKHPDEERARSIEILVTLNVAFNVLPSLLVKLDELKPEFRYTIKELPYDRIVAEMCQRPSANTMALVSVPVLPEYDFFSPALNYEKLLDMELMAKVGKGSTLSQREVISGRDLAVYPLIIHDDPVLQNMIASLMENEKVLSKDKLVITNNPELIERQLKLYDCIGFANSFSAKYSKNPAFRNLPIERSIETPVYALSSKGIEEGDLISETISLLKTVIQENFADLAPTE